MMSEHLEFSNLENPPRDHKKSPCQGMDCN
jgi:hypothetical protein